MKKDISLTIDLSDNTLARIILSVNGDKFEYKESTDTRKAQVILPLIENTLKAHDLTVQEITKVYVPVEKGSFTGLRVGAAIANTLGTVLQIPVNDKEQGVLVEPEYE